MLSSSMRNMILGIYVLAINFFFDNDNFWKYACYTIISLGLVFIKINN